MGFIGRIVVSACFALVVLVLGVGRLADAAESPSEARARLVGPSIATGPEYTAHTRQASIAAGGARCTVAPADGNYLTLYLQHAPSNPNATIVPLEGKLPSAQFLSQLNRELGPFLRTCPDGLQVGVLHYFRDVFPYGQAGIVGGRMYERPPASFPYLLQGGALVLDSARIAQSGVNDSSKATLANMQARVQAEKDVRAKSTQNREANAALARADYRKDYLSAAKRKPGIVYRYDPYWAQYRKFELARRLFDGDFSSGTDSIHFKSVFIDYAEAYSHHCKVHVKEFREFQSTVNEVVGTRDNPVTNLPENVYQSRTIKTPIDSRFANQYAGYDSAVGTGFLAMNLKNLSEGKGPNMANMTTGEFRSLLRKVLDGDLEAGGINYPERIDAKFFDNHSCTSATMTQMGENILRAASGRPSLQASATRLTGAERESDPPTQP